MDSNILVTDRSRAVVAAECKRKRYWAYHYAGTGISPIRSSIPLVTGSAVHKGLEVILKQFIGAGDSSALFDVECAIDEALKLYDDECARRGLQLQDGDDESYTIQEQKALIEGLVRGWAVWSLPQLLEQYEVAEVEREDLFSLGQVGCIRCDNRTTISVVIPNGGYYFDNCPKCKGGTLLDELLWQSRADILLKERRTGDLYVGSIKTAKEYSSIIAKKNTIDIQGFSELYSIEQRLKETDPSAHIAGVQMIYLITGKFAKDYDSEEGEAKGPRMRNSFVVRPWMKMGVISDDDSFAWSDKWSCSEPHVMGNGKKCSGGKRHRLTKEWIRLGPNAPIWNYMAMREWIDLIASGKVQGEAKDIHHPFEAIYKLPAPHLRNKDEVNESLISTRTAETRIAEDAQYINGLEEGSPEWKMALWERFPQHRAQCYKFGEDYACDFVSICLEGVSYPLEAGMFQIRKPHHEKERELFQLKGIEV